jgi:3-hydroxybutyryl-CoA dehydratase
LSKFHVRSDFRQGEKARLSKSVSETDIQTFAQLTGDFNPLHLDPVFANNTRFKGRVAHGMLSVGLISAVLGTILPGPGAIYISQSVKFLQPVRIGDILTAEVEVLSWDPSKKTVHMQTSCYNQDGNEVVTGEARLLVEPLSTV